MGYQRRGGNSAIADRFIETLRQSGFAVMVETGDWQWDAMMATAVWSIPGQEEMRLARTANEEGELFLITASWAAVDVQAVAADAQHKAFNNDDYWRTPLPVFGLDGTFASVGLDVGVSAAVAKGR